MADHLLVLTVTARAIAVDSSTLPISVVVSPRLSDGTVLGQFPDWVGWTNRLAQDGLDIVVSSGGASLSLPIDQSVLRPDLWQQLFDDKTVVEPFQFDDYSGRPVLTFSMRECMSLLKAVYQDATVSLALPDTPGQAFVRGSDDRTNRMRIRSLLSGLDLHWDGRQAAELRSQVRVYEPGQRPVTAGRDLPLDAEGLFAYSEQPGYDDLRRAATEFSVFNHMPAVPPEAREPLQVDGANVFDFHKALSALNSYPRLLRALGLIFDLELPLDFVPEQALTATSRLSVAGVAPGFDWQIEPAVRSLQTAVAHTGSIDARRFFFTAPRAFHDPSVGTLVLGLLGLEPSHFGLAQFDVDGGMHKAIIAAESLLPSGDHNLDPTARPEPAPNPEVFDAEATLPALRSGGLTLYADGAGEELLAAIQASRAFDDAVNGAAATRPLFAEDLVRGYHLDIWDSLTGDWHSLHRRLAQYRVGEVDFDAGLTEEEGFAELAITQPPPGAKPDTKDLYVHEAIARWDGWSLSAPRPFRHLSRYTKADDALPVLKPGDPPDKYDEDQPITPFRVTTPPFKPVPGSLPSLRFGACYRLRARVVDLAGNALTVDDALAKSLAVPFALPQLPEGQPYLRYEPLPAPLVVMRDPAAVTSPGSAVLRLVLRTFNASPEDDGKAADTSVGDRHILPPRTSVELGERMGMFDSALGTLKSDAATWSLIADRDNGQLHHTSIQIAGEVAPHDYPIETADALPAIPYLPDLLARGAALRDLPGAVGTAVGRVEPGGAGPAAPVGYALLSDPNPRPGSATIVGFGGPGWEARNGFRLALADTSTAPTDPAGHPDVRPRWDAEGRVLTVFMAKGTMTTVPLTSWVAPEDLRLLGVWQWLREYVERVAQFDALPQHLRRGTEADRIAHVLQRAVEGGHWMLTPPTLLTFVSAVQQPIGRPELTALNVDFFVPRHDPFGLETAPVRGAADPIELAPIVAWRKLGSTEAYLTGALRVHGSSTARVDLLATWEDPIDPAPVPPSPPVPPGTEKHSGAADPLALTSLGNGYLTVADPLALPTRQRNVGYYDPEHDQVAFVRAGEVSRPETGAPTSFDRAMPRIDLADTKHHVVTLSARSTSRFREYFANDEKLDFTRTSDPVVVDIPASARPLAPDVVYVIPTFGWQRQADTNVKRSVRFGGGLRVYLRRPWYSSGVGELLGVALYDGLSNGPLDKDKRDSFKPYITQWGMDPIWESADLFDAPRIAHFPDAVSADGSVTLEERRADGGRVDVVGFLPRYDAERDLWFADLTVDLPSATYMPFVRLALVRYQPQALPDALISRVTVSNFVQLTPDRTATVTADPYHPHTLRVVVSGVAPRGPVAVVDADPRPARLADKPTQVRVRVQRHDPGYWSDDVGWLDVDPAVARVDVEWDGAAPLQPDVELWSGTVTFSERPRAGEFRLVVEEHELVSARYAVIERDTVTQPSRVIYIETFLVDDVLVPDIAGA